MNKISLLACAIALVFTAGCLKTREQLRGESGGGQASNAPVAKQTTAQQRAEKNAPVAAAPPAQRTQEEYDEQLRQLYGRVEAAEAKVQQMEQAAQNNQKDQALQQKLTAYEEEFKRLNDEVRMMNEQMTAMRAQQAAPVAAPSAPIAVKSGGAAGEKITPFDEGEQAFKEKKWKEAIVAYEKYRSTYPKGKNFLEATYKIGLSFHEIGMKEEAKAFYEEVVAKAPKSKEAKKAQFRLKNVK